MIQPFLGVGPSFDETNYIAPSADLIGNVQLGAYSSIWFHATLRGDVNWIRIGRSSNVQDNAVVHVTRGEAPTCIGDFVTIAHGAVVHGCAIEDNVLIGMGAVVLDHASVGKDCIIGARALITPRTIIPPESLVLGSPARVVRKLTEQEIRDIRRHAEHYLEYAAIYRGESNPDRNPFYDAET
ncbi:MAG TPA: gamma carbonic anhydrase family protein [Acidobacteriota bacterium]|nr:gamma carbonic anhydrase family protein [Acidobacteriota bacterium]